MSASQSAFEKSPTDTSSPQRHLSRVRSSSSSASSDRPIYLARKEEQFSAGGLYDDIEYDSEDEQLLQDLNAKRTPFQEKLHKAQRAFGAAAACALILAVCTWLMYGFPNWIAARALKDGYTDPRMKKTMGKNINSNWKDPHGTR